MLGDELIDIMYACMAWLVETHWTLENMWTFIWGGSVGGGGLGYPLPKYGGLLSRYPCAKPELKVKKSSEYQRRDGISYIACLPMKIHEIFQMFTNRMFSDSLMTNKVKTKKCQILN